jgi:hypothetical protein
LFGRHKQQDGHEELVAVAVDAALEGDVAQVEQTVVEYLRDPTGATRGSLLAALETLEDLTDQSDAYKESVIGSGALGYASKGEVFGETGIDSVVDEVSSKELNAQVALVNAAKAEVRGPTAGTFAGLRSAHAALTAIRDDDEGG